LKAIQKQHNGSSVDLVLAYPLC